LVSVGDDVLDGEPDDSADHIDCTSVGTGLCPLPGYGRWPLTE
jgi:hypothetical protein